MIYYIFYTKVFQKCGFQQYKDQDISLIVKTIEKVYEILYYYLIINILIINLNFLIVQKKE